MKRLMAILLVLVVGWLGVLFIGFMFLGGPEDMEPDLVRNKNGEVIEFTGYSETDADLEQLRDMSELETLDLGFCEKITDTGLVHLEGMTNLQTLNLTGCEKITDTGLVYLKGMTSLRHLALINCLNITDAGLVRLKRLTKLQGLNLYGCQIITDSGVAELQKALPNCEIIR